MDLTIAIVTWNVKNYLRGCLESIFKNKPRDLELEIIVVDNHSSDGTLSMVREEFPSVRVVANPENVGFSKANNQAYKLGQGRYFLLLNPDTEIEENALQSMVEFMDTHPECGLSGPMVLNDREGHIQKSCVRFFPAIGREMPSLLGVDSILSKISFLSKISLRWRPSSPVLDWHRTQEIPSFSGCCLLGRRKAIEDVGLLDENFFMYGEDLDWCYRMVRSGWKIYYLPEAKVIHYYDCSARQKYLSMRKKHFQSHFYLYRKHRGLGYALFYRLLILAVSSGWAVFFLFKPAAFRWHWVGFWWALTGF